MSKQIYGHSDRVSVISNFLFFSPLRYFKISVVICLIVDDIVKDVSFRVTETKIVHTIDSVFNNKKYVIFEKISDKAGFIKHEDLDAGIGQRPDWDMDEPVLYVEILNGIVKFTVLEYGGTQHTDIFWKDVLLFASAGGRERRHVGGFKEITIGEVPPEIPDIATVLEKLDVLRQDVGILRDYFSPTGLRYNTGYLTIATPTVEGIYLPAHYHYVNQTIAKNARVLQAFNDGPGTLFISISSDAIVYSDKEVICEPGSTANLTDIHTCKVRADVTNTVYRLTEYILDRPEKFEISQVQNLAIPITNSSFELGTLECWDYSGDGSVAVDSTVKSTGNYSAKISVLANGTFDFWSKDLIRTMPKRAILVSGYVRASNISKVYFLIRYFTEDSNQLPSPANDNIAYEALFGYDKYLEGLSAVAFIRKLRETSAPPGAAFYQVGIRVVGTSSAGTVWLDDLSLPTFLDVEPQFRWQIVTLLPRYVLPGQTITLHTSDDGEVGEVLYFNATVSLTDAVFYIYYDNETVTLPVSVMLEAAPNVAAAYLMEIDEDDADQLKWRYYVAVTPATLIKYNYRQKVTLSNPSLTFRKALQEQIGTGNGVAKTFAGALANPLVYTGTLSITDGVEVFTDNSDGTLTGSAGGTGTINYTTGVYSVTFNTAPTLNTKIYAGYYYLIVNTTALYFDGGGIYKKIRI